MPGKNGNNVTSKNLKLNAQWLKNAARTLGMNGISTIADISPNLADAGRVAASSISTVASAASNVRRQERPIQYLLESNKYVKLGKQAINNALSDLAKGKFTNQDRGSADDELGGTSTGTYFGEMSDGSSGESTAQVQNVYNIDTKAIDNVANAVTTQTKYQLQASKANIDTMVAVTGSAMTQSQKNADAVLSQLGEMNRGVQALVAYNNETMTKFVSAAMTYYEAAGKTLTGKEKSSSSQGESQSAIKEDGGLNLDAYSSRIKKQTINTLKGTTAGIVVQMLADNADVLVNNPLELVSKSVMSKAIPEVTKKALKATDKVFGSFMTEMLLRTTDKWEADTSDGPIGKLKRLAAKAFGIKDQRQTKIDRSGKVSEEAAVFDNVTRTAIIDELPKYARESTAYLRMITELLGGDANAALRGSRILNRESGRYQSMESFAEEFSASIDEKVTSAMDKTSFGKEMRAMASTVGKTDDQIKRLNDAIDRFYVAAEKSDKGSINAFDLKDGSDMSNLIKDAGLDATMQEFIRRTLSKMAEYNTGLEDFNEGRLRARRGRNSRIREISEDTGMLRTTNLFRSGNSAQEIDVSSVTPESLLPQTRSRGGINVPTAKTKGVDEQVADALYGGNSAKLVGGATPKNMAPGSIGESLLTLQSILLRGINVRVEKGKPWKGAAGIGGHGGSSTDSSSTGKKSEQKAVIPASEDIDLSQVDAAADSLMSEEPVPTTGKGSKMANSLAHAKQAMYLMMSGNTSLAMNEMSAMFGETMSSIASSAKKHIIEPFKDAILPKKEVTDEKGNATTQRMTVLEMVREKFSSVTNSVKDTLLGKDEDGKPKKLTTVFQEGIAEWKKTIFGDKDPEEVKKEIQSRMPDAVGGAMTGGLVGMLIGGPFTGAILGAGAGFAKKSEWFQEMIFGKDKDGNEVRDGLIPHSVQKYYQENKQSLTAGAAVGGLMGLVVGGPVLGAAAGIGASILKKSDKFQELIFGKEETDEKTGDVKKVGGVLNLFKEVGGHYWKGTEKEAKGLSAKALVGAGGGLLMSLFTPLGPVGGAALGLAASVASNGDKIKQFLFGKKDKDGKLEEAGLFQKLGNDVTAKVINPLRDGVIDFFEESRDKVIDKMLSPMLEALQPLLNFGGRIYEKTLGKIAEGASKAGDMFTDLLRKVGNHIWKKTFGRFGKAAKWVGGKVVSAATGFSGKTVGKLGEFAERRNRKKSLERFDVQEKGQHANLIKEWTEKYYSDPALQTKSLEDYLTDMKSGYYYNYGEKIKNFFGTDEERAKARQETADRKAKRKELRTQSALINQLTGGSYSDTGATAKQAALDAYMKSNRFARGKGINIKGFGKMSQKEVLNALKVEESENSGISAKQEAIMDTQLEVAKQSAGKLVDIYDWLVKFGSKITGADDPERQARRETNEANKNADKAEKQRQKEEADREAARRQEAYEKALRSTAESSESSEGAALDAKITSIADKWKNAEKEILDGLKSKNPTIKRAAKKAYPAFFDEDGDRRLGDTVEEAEALSLRKAEAYDKFDAATKSLKAYATQEGVLETGFLGKTIGKIPGANLVDQGLGKLGNLRKYLNLKQHAVGGIAENEETAIVGEHGPEIVQFPNRARVLPNSKRIDVNLVSIAPELMKAAGAETAIQDVRIVGQNGLLATYGTSAKLGSKTNNSGKVENQLDDPDALVRYDDIKQDNDDYEEQEERTPSLLEKILGVFGGDGGILSKLGIIAGGAGLIALLSNADFRNLLKDTFKWAFGEDGPVQTVNNAVEGASVGATKTKDPITDKSVYVVDAETHTKNTKNGALEGALKQTFATPEGLVDTAKDAWLTTKAVGLTSVGGRAMMMLPGIAGGGMKAFGGGMRAVGGALTKSGGLVNAATSLPARVGNAWQLAKAGNGGFVQSFMELGGSMGNQAAGQGLKNAGAAATTVGAKSTSIGGKVAGFASKGKEFFKNMTSGYGMGVSILAGISADVGWDAAEAGRHNRLSGDYGFGNLAGGYRTESATAKTITTTGIGIGAAMGAAAAKMAIVGAANIEHPGGWLILIAAGIIAIAGLLAAAINALIGWIQDKSDREYSIRSNSTKLHTLLTDGITYDSSKMNPRYVYCGQESDRVLGLNEGVFVGEADVCMARFLYTIKENLLTSPGAEVLMYDFINNMAVQGVPFACALAGSSNICSADGSQANSDFGKPYITEESGFLKSAKTQVTKSRCERNIDTIMSDVSINIERNIGSDFCWNMKDLTDVYEAGKKVVTALKKEGILSDNGSVNTKGFAGEPGSNKKDSGWKSLDKICRVNGSYFLTQCLVYINSKIDVNKDGEQWLTANHDYLEILMNGLRDYLEEEYNLRVEEEKEQMRESGMSEEEIDAELKNRAEDVDSSGGAQAQSAGGISAPTERVYSSVKSESTMAETDKADFSRELRYLTAAWAYAHPAELQKWVSEHPDSTHMPVNMRNVITQWNDKNVEGLSDDRSRQELRREMLNASLEYADSHGDIFDITPYFNWDHDFLKARNKNIDKYGIGYLLRGKHKQGEGTLETKFADTDKMGKEVTPLNMHKTLFNSESENKGSEGSDSSTIGNKGFMGDIAKRLAPLITVEGLRRYPRRNTSQFDEKDLLAGIPTAAPPNRDVEDNIETRESTAWRAKYEIGKKLIENGKERRLKGEGPAQDIEGGKGNIIPFYSQKDPRWASNSYNAGHNETMADAGCGPTALSMAVNAAGGTGPTPVDAANRLSAIGARDNTGTSWSGMTRGIGSYGLTSDQASNPDSNFVDSGISSGKPVILSGTSYDTDDPFTSQGHYVVVSGKDRNGNYIINDPNGSAPVTYTKEQVVRNAAKGWRVGGGRGSFRIIKGGGRVTNLVSLSTLDDTGGGTYDSIEASRQRWIQTVRAVKRAFADLHPGYADKNHLGYNITINIGGYPLKARSDCTGMISAALNYYIGPRDAFAYSSNSYNSTTGECAELLRAAGFQSSNWPGWDSLKEGDILARNGHAVVFCRNDGNKHMVYNCGSTDAVNNPNPTSNGNTGYTTVWRIGEACSSGISNFEISSGSTEYAVSDASSTTSSGESGGFLGKLMSWGSTLASKAIGWLTGDTSLADATDWSDWKYGDTSTVAGTTANSAGAALESIGLTSTGYSGPAGAASAKLPQRELEQRVFNRLVKEGPYTPAGSAAVMGNLYAESGVRSNNVQNSCEDRVGSDDVYTAKVDSGQYTIDQFASDKAGYGLAQWTSAGRKRNLYALAKSRNVSISDPDMQVDHLLNEMRTSYSKIHQLLQTTNDVAEASYKVMHDFEAPKSRDSLKTKQKREGLSISMLENYGTTASASGTSSGSAVPVSSNEQPSNKVQMAALGGSGGGRGGSSNATVIPYKQRWKYNTSVTPIRGGGAPATSGIYGSAAHLASSSHMEDVTRMSANRINNTIQKSQEGDLIKTLQQIVQILTSSDNKLNNLSYLSDIRSLSGGNTVNNTVTNLDLHQANRAASKKESSVEKVSLAGYEEAKRIVAG